MMIEKWSDAEYGVENERRLINNEPYGTLKVKNNDLVSIPYFGLRTARKGNETSQMALVNYFDDPAWIHIGNSFEVRWEN